MSSVVIDWFCTFYVNGILQYVFFCVRFLLLNMFARFIFVCSLVCFHYCIEFHCVTITVFLFILVLIDTIGWFFIGGIKGSAATIILIHVLVNICMSWWAFLLGDVCLGVELLVSSALAKVFQGGCVNSYYLPPQHVRVQIFSLPCCHSVFFLFFILAILVGLWWYCIMSKISLSLLAVWILSFVKCPSLLFLFSIAFFRYSGYKFFVEYMH